MTRKECLDKAAECVLKDRQNQYGKPEDSFSMIAGMWTAYLGRLVSAHDVAAMMALLKIARFRANPWHLDNAVDLAGYAACMAETVTAWEREGEEDEADEEPKFKHGDRVQYRVELPSVSDWIWRDATYLRRAFSWQQDGEHIVTDEVLGPVTVKDKDIRPAPKAEGVEELVVSPFDEDRMRESMPGIVPQDGPSDFDAPQTKEELYDRIVANNPAVFGCAHKPTGEELAEMAEENPHG